MSIEDKAKAYDNLIQCLGYVQNASDSPVHISQDDATMTYIVKVGNRLYWGHGLMEALDNAAKDS